MSNDALQRLDAVLRFASARNISDLHIKALQRPVYRRHGALISRKDEPAFSASDLEELRDILLPKALIPEFSAQGEATFCYGLVGGGQFRMTVLQQAGIPAIAARVLATKVTNLRELNLPKHFGNWALAPGGLVLIAGAAGSGRSSLWAALIDHVNTSAPSTRHVLALQSPIEANFDDRVAFLRQRQIGTDCPDLASALRSAARLDCDLVAIDAVAPRLLEQALDVADAGPTVLMVVPGTGPIEALRRLLDDSDPVHREVLRQRLTGRLRAVVSQTLIPTQDGQSRVPAVQALVATAPVQEVLRGGHDLELLRNVMEQGRAWGMVTIDQSLAELVSAGQISLEVGLQYAHSPEQMRSKIGHVRPGATGLTEIL